MEQTKGFFSDSALKKLILPLMVEQTLAISVGMVDTIMISYAGEAAISGVALVDLINVLLINIFAAIATGGAVVASQYMGKGDRQKSLDTANQLVMLAAVISLGITALILIFKHSFLLVLYRHTEAQVMENAVTYLRISAYSYPFIAVFSACAALFRTMGNSKISMNVSAGMNLLNVIGNIIFIFGFGLGVAGAAWASMISRAAAAFVLLCLIRKRQNDIYVTIRGIFRWNRELVKKILYIGIPGGIESGIFQLGRVLVVSIIAGFGTVQIAANAVANNLDNIGCIGGQAVSLAMAAVIGRCVGARDYEQVDFYVKKLMKTAYMLGTLTNGLVLLALPIVLRFYALTPETGELAGVLILIHCGFGILMWPAAFTLPAALRAANDAGMAMGISVFSMLVFRVAFSVYFGIHLDMGAVGVWLAMLLDWLFRMIMFILRYRRGRWRGKCLV